jgi:hypothetical protein
MSSVDPYAVALVAALGYGAYSVSGRTSSHKEHIIETAFAPISAPSGRYRTSEYGHKTLEDAMAKGTSVYDLQHQNTLRKYEHSAFPDISESGQKMTRSLHPGNGGIITLNNNASEEVRSEFYSQLRPSNQKLILTPHPVYGRGFTVEGYQNAPASYDRATNTSLHVF